MLTLSCFSNILLTVDRQAVCSNYVSDGNVLMAYVYHISKSV